MAPTTKPNPELHHNYDADADADSDSEPDVEPQVDDNNNINSEPESDSDSESETEPKNPVTKFQPEPEPNPAELSFYDRSCKVIDTPRYQHYLEYEETSDPTDEQLFDFPPDNENWTEADLRELWADGPIRISKPGWDPALVDENDIKVMEDEIKEGRDPPIAPFYVPYRKYYPAIPDNNVDINTPQAVVEELDRIEEFLRWVSYIFPDDSSYEGTVWDDLAHGKGVYVTEQGLVRYEGEWLQNNMEGHGVVEVDVPDIEPIPGSKLEEEMRAEGHVFKRDFMNPEDKEWLEMDIEDSVQLCKGNSEIPWYEKDEWIKLYGEKPEKGRYRYAGQWKHSRMHGCGVYEVNERTIYGRFYFGQLLDDPHGCDVDICAMHAGIAEVAAAKARMFVNKPDGMIREQRGPYGDPQHPYFYEEEDVWQAPGFINQFYEVPDYWKTYVHEVDQEREMWLNSFYKAPLRLPMPAELEYWWQNDKDLEFLLLNKEPEPDPEDPSKLVYTEDPVILHTPTGRIINYIEDEEHGLRLFWQPSLKEGEAVNPEKVEFLPLGFDEFYGQEEEEKTFSQRVFSSVGNTFKPWFDKLETWTEEQKKAGELRKNLIEQELELVEAELCLEEAIEDMEEELKQEEKEAQKIAEMGFQEEDATDSPLPDDEEKTSPQEEEIEEEEEDDLAPSSFGSVTDDVLTRDKGNESGKSPFSTLSFASSGLLSTVPAMVERSFSMWKKGKSPSNVRVHVPSTRNVGDRTESSKLVSFPRALPEGTSLKVKNLVERKIWVKQRSRKFVAKSQPSSLTSQSIDCKDHPIGHRPQRLNWLHSAPETNSDCILSLQMPVQCLDMCIG